MLLHTSNGFGDIWLWVTQIELRSLATNCSKNETQKMDLATTAAKVWTGSKLLHQLAIWEDLKNLQFIHHAKGDLI